MEEKTFEEICMELIATAGEAKNDFIKAIRCAKEGNFAEAEKLIEKGDENYNLAHTAHFQMLQLEEMPSDMMAKILLIHSEDQLNGAETSKIFAQDFIELYKRTAD